MKNDPFTSLVNEEFLAFCGSKHVKGSAFVPRHQGSCEKEHQAVMHSHLLLMNENCGAFPQEWPSFLAVVEYLLDTAPRLPYGLSAYDVSTAYALAGSAESRLLPFKVPLDKPESEVLRKTFRGFRELYGLFQRHVQEQSQQRGIWVNSRRHQR